MLNPFGSVKDRAAWNMARQGLPDAVERGATVIELSSGNTAKALAVIAGMHGLPFTPAWAPPARPPGWAKALRAHDPDVRVIGLVGQKSDFTPGFRNIDEVHEVGLFDPATYDAIEAVGVDEAIEGMLTLIRRCGLLAGPPTGGASYCGAVRHLRSLKAELMERETAVFIVCDRIESYLSHVRERRPELLGHPPAKNSVATLTDAETAASAVIDTADAQKWIAAERPLVVDLRGPFAYAALHIGGSINIVDKLFEDLLRGGLPFSKRQPVLLVCPVGEKSVRYAALLTRHRRSAADAGCG